MADIFSHLINIIFQTQGAAKAKQMLKEYKKLFLFPGILNMLKVMKKMLERLLELLRKIQKI